MNFLFFDAANHALFTRSDAEQAEHCHEEMSLHCLFPYDPGKVITNGGMRIGYTDSLGVFQCFEIRQCRNYEPDHYQEVTAEHIAISELTDEHFPGKDWTNVTAAAALADILTGTLWSVGNVTASNISSGNSSMGDVWQDVRTIENNWNVYITPRVVVNASGIVGRYLDIAPAGGIWRGLRLSLDKNMDEAGVTWDDTRCKTALYGYGKSVAGSGQDQNQPLTFADVVWAETADHPAKPAGQKYLEDPAATAAYGRNGRPRFGFYQNGDISDPEILLQKTWETLKTVSVPDVSIDGVVRDLYRLGFTDVPIRLHDTAIVEIRPTGVNLQKEIIKYTEDLLNPQSSRLNIGAYIPNIIYINRENAARSGAGGGSGGQSNIEYKLGEYYTQIEGNSQELRLKAAQRDLDATNQDVDLLKGELIIEAGKVTQIVTAVGANGEVTAASITTAINNAGSSATINAQNIYLNGTTIVKNGNDLIAPGGWFTDLYAGSSGGAFTVEGTSIHAYSKINAEGGIEALDGATVNATNGEFSSLKVGTNTASWKSQTVVTGVTRSNTRNIMYAINGDVTNPGTMLGSIVTNVSTATIYYLGR